jgi:hypothetical protein
LENGSTTQGDGRWKQAVLALAVCVLVGIGVVAFWPGEREPAYNGKKLSEWLWTATTNLPSADRDIIGQSVRLEELTNISPAALEAVKAVRAIGTNAFPWLIARTLERPWWSKKLESAYFKLPGRLHCRLVTNWVHRNVSGNVARALVGFHIMGPEGALAVPQLAKVLKESKSKDTRQHVIMCLKLMKGRARGALPALKEIVLTEDSYLALDAAAAMESIEPGSSGYFRTNL